MPIYEYQCQSCGHQLEKLQKMSDPLLTDCPECNKPELIKLISAAGFQLKGTGWYQTDFKDSGQKKDQNKENKDGAKQEASNPPPSGQRACEFK